MSTHLNSTQLGFGKPGGNPLAADLTGQGLKQTLQKTPPLTDSAFSESTPSAEKHLPVTHPLIAKHRPQPHTQKAAPTPRTSSAAQMLTPLAKNEKSR